MPNRKDEAIQKVMTDFEIMANLTLKQLDYLETLLQSGEITIPEEIENEIIANEEQIDQMEVKLSERIVNTIVLYQPVASEIRKIMACYRIVINIERIGDYAVNLTKYLKKIKSLEVYSQSSDTISTMFITAVQMVSKSLLSFSQHDKDFATWTIKNDSVVDEINKKMLKNLISKSDNFEDSKKALISFITIKEMVDNIERIADHATNIAEAAIYYIEGKDIRHLPNID
ncbi:MAG TPA: PhoU domain-containing protein [Prolixibacteraceae bacterium]|nr:PhoU domain-containing protein [Prolixibacteraceae bacterium]